MYERPLGKVKVSEIQLSLLRVTFHTMSLFYLRAQNLRAYGRKNYTAVEIHLKGAKVRRADLEIGTSHIGLVFILYQIAFRVGRARNEPATMKTATHVTKFARVCST